MGCVCMYTIYRRPKVFVRTFTSAGIACPCNTWWLSCQCNRGHLGNSIHINCVHSTKPLFWCCVVPPDAPVLTSTPADNTHSVKFGDDLQLSCSANGTLPIKLTWFYNGVQLVTGGRVVVEPFGNLTIRNTSTSGDAGVYQCYAENEAGFTSHAVLVDVFSELIMLSVTCSFIFCICLQPFHRHSLLT